MVLSFFFAGKRRRKMGDIYFSFIRDAARDPAFFGTGKVNDDVDGRFEVLVLHSFLLMQALRTGEPEKRLDQLLFDALFRDLDTSLRELGTSDTRIGKKIKSMAAAFYGRSQGYHEALLSESPKKLEQALLRNLFGEAADDRQKSFVGRLAKWVLQSQNRLHQQSTEQLFDEGPDFAPVNFSK